MAAETSSFLTATDRSILAISSLTLEKLPLGEHFAGGHIERGEQCGGAMADIVLGVHST